MKKQQHSPAGRASGDPLDAVQGPLDTFRDPLATPSLYERALAQDTLNRLTTIVSTPDVETGLSRDLAERFNENHTAYDSTIDARYIETGIGGSRLHHNLDGSHTFDGAMATLRAAFPHDEDFQLRLAALEHLARDFTTPSGINPFLNPPTFVQYRDFLHLDLGISRGLAHDLVNINAAELGGAVIGAGVLFFPWRPLHERVRSRQVGRLLLTSFFAGNPFGLLAASGVFIAAAVRREVDMVGMTWHLGLGAAEVLAAATFLPSAPLSVGLLLAAGVCAAGQMLLGGGGSLDEELERVLRAQFPGYRSYLADS